MKQTTGDALRQTFMSKEEYGSLRSEERVVNRLARPLRMTAFCALWTCVFVAFVVMVDIVFSVTDQKWRFCHTKRLNSLDVVQDPVLLSKGDSKASYALTEEEAAQYFWIVVFLPTSVVFGIAVVYLFAGIAVAYSAPERHVCLRVVENNCCASQRGGVRCLAILNILFFVVFALLALFLGSSILTLETDCSLALFWCYEVVCWGTAFLLAGTAYFLRRKAAVIMDSGEYYGVHTIGVELLEASPVEPPTHIIEKRVAEGFKSWSGAYDSDDEEPDAHLTTTLVDGWEVDESEETYSVPSEIITH